MNFFRFFRRKKEPAGEPAPKVMLPDGKLASAQLASIMPRLDAVALPFLRITATPSGDLFLFDSKFGGDPWWPADQPYPVDAEGKPMYLLAQLNFSQMPRLEGYPDKGILQFYLSNDDLYGADFDHPTRQDRFRVIYFEDTSATGLEHFDFLPRHQEDLCFPLTGQLALQFTPGKDYYSYSDLRYPEDLTDELAAGSGRKGAVTLENELVSLYPDTGHKVGGYAYFTQDDPRRDTAFKDYILLLQIDSQGDHICWGDFGVGNFFIHPADLERKDFSRVMYSWDCT